MKIELTVEGQEPVVHKLSKDKTLLGAGQDCDIVVEADGISRKHLMIIAENDQYFAVDQGSTNGSFINEERMVPGQRTSFNSFFPLKMGFYVTIALLSDDDGAGNSFDFAKSLTKTSDTPKSKAAPTQTGIQAPKGGGAAAPKIALQTSEKSKKERPASRGKKDEAESGSQGMKIAAILIAVLGTAGLWYLTKAPEEAPVVQETAVVNTQPEVKLEDFDFSFPEVPGVEGISNMASDQKCNEVFKPVCDKMKLPKDGFSMAGITSTPSSLVIVLPALSFEEMLSEFGPTFKWPQPLIDIMQGSFEMRDLIGLYIGRIDSEAWNVMAVDAPVLGVIFVDRNGARVGDVWVTDLKNLVKASLTPEFSVGYKQTIDMGVAGYNHITGFFRRVEF